jgi:site-specific DNA recombinase
VRQLVRERSIDALICYHPDRLSRDMSDLNLLIGELRDNGVAIWFVHGPSGASATDRLMQTILGFKAEQEREDTKRRTMEGKRKTAIKGKLPTGAGRGLYGYRAKWIINELTGKPTRSGREILPEEAATVTQIFDWCNAGLCDYDIARKLNLQGVPTKGGSKWHPLTVRRVLLNTGYMGITYYGQNRVEKVKNSNKRITTPLDRSQWITIEGFTPPIVSKEVFELAQQRLKSPKQRPGRAIEPYLLASHLNCADCGSPMVGHMMNRKYRYYRCRAAWATATGPQTCQAKYVNAEKLDHAVWGNVCQVLEEPEVVLTELRRLRDSDEGPINDEIATLKREIRRCKDQEQRLVKLFQFGEVDDEWIKAQSGPLKLLRERHEVELDRLTVQKQTMNQLRKAEYQIESYCERMREGLASFDFEEKRTALKALQIRAFANKTDVKVKGILGIVQVEPDFSSTAQTLALPRGYNRRSPWAGTRRDWRARWFPGPPVPGPTPTAPPAGNDC